MNESKQLYKYVISPMGQALDRRIVHVADRKEAIKHAKALYGNKHVSIIKFDIV
jgi:hypothetical protein